MVKMSASPFRFATIYGDPDLRKGLYSILAETVRYANAKNPAGWGASLRSNKSYVNVIVGRIFVLSLEADRVWIVVDPAELAPETRAQIVEHVHVPEGVEFKTVPEARSYVFSPSEAVEVWPAMKQAHFAVIARAASTVGRTPVHPYFSDELLDHVEGVLGEELPRPIYERGGLTSDRIAHLIQLVKQRFPGWSGFEDSRFEADEINYKQATVSKAADVLARPALEGLIERENYEEFINRVDKIGKDNNLLFRGVPMKGDLNVLYQESLPKAEFCRAFFDLIHGEGDGPERLERYLTWIAATDLPSISNKWTFPTYYMFICHPGSEVLVKPEAIRGFIKLAGLEISLSSRPSADTYAQIRDTFVELKHVLEDHGARDMIDVQGLVWVAVGEEKERRKAAKERVNGDLSELAEQAFQQMLGDPYHAFAIRLRQERARQLCKMLSNPEAVDLKAFNRNVWVLEHETLLDGEEITGEIFASSAPPGPDRSAELEAALESGRLELHGNYCWGTASRVFGPMLQRTPDQGSVLARVVRSFDGARELTANEVAERIGSLESEDDDAGSVEVSVREVLESHPEYFEASDGRFRLLTKDEYQQKCVHQALAVLNDANLAPIEKVRPMRQIPGFGYNVVTGLVMLCHPNEFSIYNERSRKGAEKLGLDASKLEPFQEAMAELGEQLGASDRIELDWFLAMLYDGRISIDLAERTGTWWVNQGDSYREESQGGYVWAPTESADGRQVPHYDNVARLRVSDRIVHYAKGAIRALGTVADGATQRAKPGSASNDESTVGFWTRVTYEELAEPVPLETIPLQWRQEERGPFNIKGEVNQGYLFPLTPEFAGKLFQELLGAADVDYEEPSFPEIQSAIQLAGMRISERVLRRYHLSLKTRGFVIVSGISGTGKTWLTELYARAVGARYRLVPVAPNWTSNEDLLGYYNPLTDTYHDTSFSWFLKDAAAEYERAQASGRVPRPYHLTLDEMNLARVEYYFARFLSAMEVRQRDGEAQIELGPEDTVVLPPNLFFIGTVNVDETTHGFADKVYDRAQLVELEAPREMLQAHLGEAEYAEVLMDIWDAVHAVAPFAFRVVDEIEAYATSSQDMGVTWSEALDEQLLQKILPKCKGADPRVGDALARLIEICDGRFPHTMAKAKVMNRALIEHGFTSFF